MATTETNHAKEQAQAQLDSIMEMVKRLGHVREGDAQCTKPVQELSKRRHAVRTADGGDKGDVLAILSIRSSPGTPERRILGAVAPYKDAPGALEGSE